MEHIKIKKNSFRIANLWMEIWKGDDVSTESASHHTAKFSDCDIVGNTTAEWQNDTQPWL